MRACFIDHDQEANYTLLRKHKVDEVVYPSIGENVNASLLEKAKNQGFNASLHIAWNWTGGFSSGAKFAEYCDRELRRIAWLGNPKLVADIEKGAGLDDLRYVDYVVDFCRRWRELRPTRPTDITLEGMQGGLFDGREVAVAKIINANVGMVPQAYTGLEQPRAEDVIWRNLAPYFPAHKLRIYYLPRGGAPPMDWDGYLWRQGLLN